MGAGRTMLAMLAALTVSLAPGPGAAQSVVATRHLRPGTVIGVEDMRSDVAGNDGAALMAEFTGLEVRRTIYAGRELRRDDLGPPTIVERNEIVMIVFRSGRLGIRTEARALGAGSAGQRIRVMNIASHQTVFALIIGPGIVEVGR